MRTIIRTDFESADRLANIIDDLLGTGACTVYLGNPASVDVKDEDYPIARAITGKMFGPCIKDAGPAPIVHTHWQDSYLTYCGERRDSIAKPDQSRSSAGWDHRNPLTCPECRKRYTGQE